MAERGEALGPTGPQAGGAVRADGDSEVRWSEIARSAEFARLEALRRRVTLVILGTFGVIFGTFLILSGYARPFMRKSVDGGLTVAYVWILGLTVLAWVLVWTYLRFAERFEAMGHRIAQDAVASGERPPRAEEGIR